MNSLPFHNINLSPPPPHLFSSSFTIFIIFPPQSWFPSSSTISLFSLLHLHLLVYSIYFSIHKYIDLLSTLHRPHIDPTPTPHWPQIDPTSTLDSTFFQHSLVNSETIYNHHHILSLLHHHHHHISIVSLHHHHISIVFPPPAPPPPPPHFYCFHSYCFATRKVIWVWPFWPEVGLFGLSGRKTIGGVKTIEMWWWWRENNRSLVVVKRKQ